MSLALDHDFRGASEVLYRLEPASPPTPAAQPFVKWAGGKRSLLSELEPYFPDQIETYWEPFVGGGAVFFAMANRIEKAMLSDTNVELVITYKVVKTRVGELIKKLKRYAKNHYSDCEFYNRVRAREPNDPVDVAARFIYLNKTCFNGLYRVNKSGKFNVPKGNYAKPNICDEERLLAASSALENAEIKVGDFATRVRAKKGHFVYCDPPYDDCFTGYQPNGFDENAQKRLRLAVDEWSAVGARVVVSNSDTQLMREIYDGYDQFFVNAPRNISSKASTRRPAAEIIVTNHE